MITGQNIFVDNNQQQKKKKNILQIMNGVLFEVETVY